MIYQIKPGFSFLDSDGQAKTGGQCIDLSDEAAVLHAEKIEQQIVGAAKPSGKINERHNVPDNVRDTVREA